MVDSRRAKANLLEKWSHDDSGVLGDVIVGEALNRFEHSTALIRILKEIIQQRIVN